MQDLNVRNMRTVVEEALWEQVQLSFAFLIRRGKSTPLQHPRRRSTRQWHREQARPRIGRTLRRERLCCWPTTGTWCH